jgi:hypothetical protein
MIFAGGCHCGCIEIELATHSEPSRIDVRACQCSFCRKHNSRAIGDPNGRIVIRINDPQNLSSYEFGLRTATYLVCRRCGVYVAAVTKEEPLRAIAILNALRDHERFTQPARPVDYSNESREERLSRRRLNWTPANMLISDRPLHPSP